MAAVLWPTVPDTHITHTKWKKGAKRLALGNPKCAKRPFSKMAVISIKFGFRLSEAVFVKTITDHVPSPFFEHSPDWAFEHQRTQLAQYKMVRRNLLNSQKVTLPTGKITGGGRNIIMSQKISTDQELGSMDKPSWRTGGRR